MRKFRAIAGSLIPVALCMAGIILASPWMAEKTLEQDCSQPEPSDLCLARMRSMGHLWSQVDEMDKAKTWYRRAADHGDAVAMFHLAWVYQEFASKDHAAYLERLAALRSQEFRDPAALAAARERPDEINSELAEGWYRKSAEKGFAPAMNNLGQMLLNGPHRNIDAAFEWHMDAAKAGNPVGSWNVPIAYMAGHGVVGDPVEALKWSTWTPRPDRREDLFEPTLQRTILFGSTLPADRRVLLRAAADVGEPVTFTARPLKPSAAVPTPRPQ